VRGASSVERLNGFRSWIGERIKGQPEVLEALDAHFGRSELGLTEPDFVLGAFLFVGPTGVGKTETALLTADYLLGPDAVARLNMAEFKEAGNVGELRERLVQARHSGKRLYLFDEIEKAHWEVLDLLLQILDKGAEIAAPDGTPLSFTDSYVVMTSNLGAREAMRSRTGNYTSFSNTIREYVVRYLRPELIGRLAKLNGAHGGLLFFRRLEESEQRELAGFHLERALIRMRDLGHGLAVSPGALEFVIRQGFSDDYGARRLLGLINNSIEGAVGTALRAGLPTNGVLIERSDGRGLYVRQTLAKEHSDPK
jgi:ATP-dependent Clp protease ATP-binding subunit ClpA